MAVLLCFIASQLLSAQLGLSETQSKTEFCMDGQKQCVECPTGQYQSSCTQCSPCADGTFKMGWNCETSCFPCFRDCREVLHMKVEQPCSPVADVRCRCQPGYICTKSNSNTGDCRECEKKPKAKPTPKDVSTTSSVPCLPPKCGSQSSEVVPVGNATHDSTHYNTGESNSVLVAILCPVLTIGIIALILVFCIRWQGEEDCFKQVLKLCNKGVKDGTAKTPSLQPKEPVGLLPHPLPAANLGPVHVHSAGTVIFSLLNQFTGQGEVAGEVGKEGQKERDEEKGGGFQIHPAPSIDIHLSQQERNEEMDSVFVPSQEQGKDCHISKEEVL